MGKRWRSELNFRFLILNKVPEGTFDIRVHAPESPRKNIFEMNLSLLTGLAFFLPFSVLGVSILFGGLRFFMYVNNEGQRRKKIFKKKTKLASKFYNVFTNLSKVP